MDEVEAAVTATVEADLAELDREGWLRTRHGGLGGSDASGVLGLSQYTTPLRLWLEKTGTFRPPDDAGEAALWGNLLEDAVAAETEARYGVTLYKPRFLYRSSDPAAWFQLGNPDRIGFDPTTGDLGVYEGKSCSTYVEDDWVDGPATHALIQANHYLGVLGPEFRWARISCLIGGQRLVSYRVERDDELIAMILDAEADFWHKVENKIEPAPMGYDSDSDLLRQWWPSADEDSTTILPGDAVALRSERDELKAQHKAIEFRLTEIENQFRAWLTNHALGRDIDGSIIATHKTQSNNRFQLDAFREARPELAAEFTSTDQTIRKLVFPKPKADKKKETA